MIFQTVQNKKIDSIRGFTLIELLVSVTLFSIIMSIVSGIFVSTIKVQRRVLAAQELLDQSGYLMEYMSRSIRMARKETEPGGCITQYYNYETNAAKDKIEFKDYHGDCQAFFRKCNADGCRIMEHKAGSENALTSTNLEVVSFNVGSDSSWEQPPFDNDQPRVTLFLEIKVKGENQSSLKFQTTVSQRNMDFQR